jgi:cation transport protein ChaC
MWVFGYGSLIWDGWENSYGCLRKCVAVLNGYRRTFNKASTKNRHIELCKAKEKL